MGKLNNTLTPTDHGNPTAMKERVGFLKQHRRELEYSIRPVVVEISETQQEILVLEWKIYNTELSHRRAESAQALTGDDPLGCPAEHRGAWDGTRDKKKVRAGQESRPPDPAAVARMAAMMNVEDEF